MSKNYTGVNAGSHLYNMVGRIFTARVTENASRLTHLANRCGEVVTCMVTSCGDFGEGENRQHPSR